MVVLKFGEASLKNGQSITYITEIVNKFRDKKVLIVVSAMDSVMDLLISIFQNCRTGQLRKAEKEIEKLYKVHKQALSDLKLDTENYKITYRELEGLLEKLYMNLCKKTKFSPASYDYVVSFGERFSSLLVSAALIKADIRALQVDGSQVIVASSNYGNARAFIGITQKKAKEFLLPLIYQDIVPVIAGTFALNRKGQVVILGNRGLDCTASIIARALDAKEIVLWKEVGGVFSNDPLLDDNTRFYSELS